MMTPKIYDSLLILDKLLSRAYGQINLLEEIENEKAVLAENSKMFRRIDLLLAQIYSDRTVGNYRSAIKKCLFLTGYIQRELREQNVQ